MTVLKLSEVAALETALITVPAISMPDTVDSSEDPAALRTKDSSLARSCSGVIAVASAEVVAAGKPEDIA